MIHDWAVTPVASQQTKKFQKVEPAVAHAVWWAGQGVRTLLTHQGAGRKVAEVFKGPDGTIHYLPGTGYWTSRIIQAVEVLNAKGAVDATQPRP